MPNDETPSDSDTKTFDILDKIRHEPLPVIAVVSFVVASSVLGLGLQIMSVYRDADRDKREAIEERYSAQLELAEFRIKRLELNYEDLSTEYQEATSETNRLRDQLRTTGSPRQVQLVEELDRAQQRTDLANGVVRDLRKQIEQLQLNIVQLQQPSPDADETERVVRNLQKQLQTAQSRVADFERAQPRPVNTTLKLVDILTIHDGTAGATDWEFQISFAETPLVLQAASYDDDEPTTASINKSVSARSQELASAELRVAGTSDEDIAIVAIAKLDIPSANSLEPHVFEIPVVHTERPADGAFVFRFELSATPLTEVASDGQ